MAATTISHNTPSAGSIAWTAFNIAYAGKNYTVPAGNSAAKFVWWVYNGGAPQLRTGDVLPTLTADDTVLFLNKQGIGQLLPETNVVDGSLIVSESIYAQAIASDQIASRHIMSDAITTKHLAANSVTADQLSVGTVSANLVANGSFEDFDASGNVIGWEVTSMTGGTIAPVSGVSSSGAIAVQMNATSTSAFLRMSQKADMSIPVSAADGRRWYVSARMGAGTAISRGSTLRVLWRDANRNFLSYDDIRTNSSLTTTFSVYEGQVTPPAAARYLAIEIIVQNTNVPSKVYVDEVTVHEVVVSAIIGDGAITADKVAAKAITADKLTIRDSTNLLTDPGFEYGGSSWKLGYGATVETIPAAEIRVGGFGNRALQVAGTTQIKDFNTEPTFPAEAGEWYYASCYVRKTTDDANGTVGIGLSVKRTGLGDTWPVFKQVTAQSLNLNEWTLIEGKAQLPASTTAIQLRLTVRNDATAGIFQFDDVVLRRMNGGELVVDGAIKTNHMTVNTISGNVIAANTLAASKMLADTITSRELLVSEIWANTAWIEAINGKIITGAVLRTAASGARVEMTKAGLTAYDSTGAPYWDARDGKLAMQGTLTVVKSGGTNGVRATLGVGTSGFKLPVLEFTDGGRVGGATVSSFQGDELTMASGEGYGSIMMDESTFFHGQSQITLNGDINLLTGGGTARGAAGNGWPKVDVGPGNVTIPRGDFRPNTIWGKPTHAHTRFTFSASLPHSTQWGPGMLAWDSSRSSPGDSGINCKTSDYITFSEAGVYTLSGFADTGAAAAADSYMQVRYINPGNILVDGPLLTVGTKTQGPWEFPIPGATFWMQAGGHLRFTFLQKSGATQKWTGAINVTRIS